jgi:hypothetical protein
VGGTVVPAQIERQEELREFGATRVTPVLSLRAKKGGLSQKDSRRE